MQDKLDYFRDIMVNIQESHSSADEVMNFIESMLVLLEDSDSKLFRKAVLSKTFKIGRLTVDMKYNGDMVDK